ncbi:MAG: carbohydrate porin [Planctomycetota bacterium]
MRTEAVAAIVLLIHTAAGTADDRLPGRLVAAPPTAGALNVAPSLLSQPLHVQPAPPLIAPLPSVARTDEGKDEAAPDEAEELSTLFGPGLHGRGGVSFEYLYTGEVFTNMRGGIRTAGSTQYRGDFDAVLTLDLEHYGLAPGGRFLIFGENGHGQGISEDYVGDIQFISNIDAPDLTQVSEYWWEKRILDDRLGVRLGKQDCNAEFAVVDLGLDFIQSSFGLHPSIPMPTWPDGSAAVVVFYQMTDQLLLMTGVWDGRPDGRTWGFSGSGATFSILELKFTWALGDGRLPGDFHFGAWYHSDDFDRVGPVDEVLPVSAMRTNPGKGIVHATAEPPETYSGNYGVYFGYDQMLWKESADVESIEGLGFFAQYAWAPDERNLFPIYFGAGLLYRGLLPARENDVCGLGMAQLVFSSLSDLEYNETAVELFYKYQVAEYLFVQPDLQYIARPGGQYQDAFVFGLRFECAL